MNGKSRPVGGSQTPATASTETVRPASAESAGPRQPLVTDAALRYASIGWPVFTLSRTKVPLKLCGACPPHGPDHDGDACECLTCHGFYAATTDADRVAEMIHRHPDGMLAIRTGAPSGLVVVDIDPRSGGLPTLRALEQAGQLPPTVRQLSGGDGLHLLYAHPGGMVHGGAGKLGPGADVKADGGYFVVAPSVHPGTRRPYRWARSSVTEPAPLHPELLERLRPAVVAPAPAVFRTPGACGGRGRLLGVLTRLAEERNTRNDMLFWAAKKVGVMHHAGALPDLDAAVAALQDVALAIGLTPGEIHNTIPSGLRAVTR